MNEQKSNDSLISEAIDKLVSPENYPSTATLNDEQLKAIQSFAASHGRSWKSKLRDAWMTGQYDGFEGSNYLQQIRNSFGPSWLIKFKLPITKPTSAEHASDYFIEYLNLRSTETFIAIAGGYKNGHCKRLGVILRVSNHGASLITTYQTKGEDGQWSGTNEHSEAL